MEKIKLIFKNIKRFIKNNPREFWVLVTILATGAFFRLYRISEYMTFLGDEGRDMIIVRRIFTELHPPLIGPGTSIGNMYLGPLYYYMMAPATLLANFSPTGPAVMVALLGTATIGLTWWIGREWFGKVGGLTAASLYAISPTVIIYSKSSWNPNIMPFFALISIYSIWRVWKRSEFKWLMILAISFAFVLQSHYLGLIILPVLGIYWILGYLNTKKAGKAKEYLKTSLYSLVIFLLLMSPLLIFDLRHNFQNFMAMKNFSSQSGGSFAGPIEGVKNFIATFTKINTRILAGRNEFAGTITTAALIIGTLWLYAKRKANPILLTWVLVGVFGLALYKSDVFDHYMGFLFPVPFLLTGALVQKIVDGKNKTIISGLGLSIILLVFVNLKDNPLRYQPNRQMQRSMEIAAFINGKSMGNRFNLATLSERSNRDVYQYFLLVWGAKVVDTDPNSVFYTVTDQLFVVCEKPKESCDPTHDPSAWVTNFGWSNIDDHWEVAGVNIYKLGHAK